MEYGAITIDTSIFERKGLMLESGLLKTLEQFNGKPSRLILSEIVVREVYSHLVKQIAESRTKVSKALRLSKTHLAIDDSNIQEAEKLLLPAEDDKQLAKKRLEKYIAITGCEIIPVDGNVELADVVKRYFKSEPPFASTGKKKSEFPDAMALMSLETWAEENDTKVLAVSDDGDWESFAKKSNSVDIIKDLAAAIAIFQPQNAAIEYCARLAGDLIDGRPEDIYETIAERLNDEVSEIDLCPEAASSFFWEFSGMEVEFKGFEFVVGEDKNAIIQPVQAKDGGVVVEAKVRIQAIAFGSFSLSVHDSIDKDYVSIGDASASSELDFEAEILFTLEGDFVNQPEDVEVTDFELLSHPNYVDFGEIEPDWWGEEDREQDLEM